MIVSTGDLKGYRIEGDLKPGSKVDVYKPGGEGFYTVRIKPDGGVACNCQASKFRGRCKHADYIGTLVPKAQRFLRAEIEPLILEVLKALHPAIVQAEVCGSYRRGRADLKDVDILIIGNPQLALEIAQEIGTDVVMSGDYIVRFHYGAKKILFDLTFTQKETWGAAVLYRTGSQAFNIKCRGEAKRHGWKLNEYGLWDAKDNLIEAETEAGILRHLGIGWVEPKDR